MGADRHEVVIAPGGARELVLLFLILGHQAAALAQLDVRPLLFAAVVVVGDVRIEADEARETSAAAVRLVDDLLVVDALEELPRDGHSGFGTAAVELVQEAVGDELQPLLDQLVVDLPLPADLGRFLELGRKPDLELAEPDVVEARGVDVGAGDAAPEASAEFDGAVDGPVRLARVIDRDKYLSIHGAPLDGVLRPVLRCSPQPRPGAKPGCTQSAQIGHGRGIRRRWSKVVEASERSGAPLMRQEVAAAHGESQTPSRESAANGGGGSNPRRKSRPRR